MYLSVQGPDEHEGLLHNSTSRNISISCFAEGARPEVSIQFRISNGRWIPPTTKKTRRRGLLFDTRAELMIDLSDRHNVQVIECQTYGQVSVGNVSHSQTLCKFFSSENAIQHIILIVT